MSNSCAWCGADRAPDGVSMPATWEQYLVDERAVVPPIGSWEIPLCWECHDWVDDVREEYAWRDSLSESERAKLDAFLDDLNVDALVDDHLTAADVEDA